MIEHLKHAKSDTVEAIKKRPIKAIKEETNRPIVFAIPRIVV